MIVLYNRENNTTVKSRLYTVPKYLQQLAARHSHSRLVDTAIRLWSRLLVCGPSIRPSRSLRVITALRTFVPYTVSRFLRPPPMCDTCRKPHPMRPESSSKTGRLPHDTMGPRSHRYSIHACGLARAPRSTLPPEVQQVLYRVWKKGPMPPTIAPQGTLKGLYGNSRIDCLPATGRAAVAYLGRMAV